MSIKQNGGVFGRNPTFNDVTIDGTLNFNGDIDIDSDLKVAGDLDVTGAANLASLNVTSGISSLSVVDTANSAVSYPIKASHLPSGTTGNGLGVGIDFHLKNSTYSNIQQVATIEAVGVSEGEIANNLVFKTKWNATHADRLVLRGRGGVNGVVDLDLIYGNLKVAAGFGIDFSLTSGTGTSELLDDYEEGVFSPVYAPTAGSFTTITTVSSGRYTKVGRLVTLFVSIRTSGALDVTGASGNLKITGLPFACNATLSGGGPDLSHQAWNLGTDILNTRISVPAGTSEIILYKNTMNGSSFPSGNITVPEMSTSGSSFANLITFTASYEV